VTNSANLDLVRSIFADWERGDFSSAGWADPDVELVFADGPAPSKWTGLAGMAEGMREFLTSWGEFQVVADEYRELDRERVLVLVHRRARGKTSGLDVVEPRATGAIVYYVRDGRAFRLIIYWDRDRALADLGLKE
jgi:ketosteroid isomerase-like protein